MSALSKDLRKPYNFPLNAGMFIRPRILPLSAWTGHVPFGSWLINAIAPKQLVELGTHRGTSYLSFCQAVQEARLDARCYAVDTWEGDEHAGEYGQSVYDVLNEYHQKLYAGFSQLLRMKFDDALSYFAEGTVDMLHIDGLHTYDAVRHDFESWLPKLSDRAVVLFHDTNVKERGFGVWKFWREIANEYPSFEFSHSHGLGVLVVGKNAAPLLTGLLVEKGSTQAEYVNRLFEFQGARLKADFEAENLLKSLRDSHRQVAELHEAVAALNMQVQLRQQDIETRDAMLQEVSSSIGDVVVGVSESCQVLRADLQNVNKGIDNAGRDFATQYGMLTKRVDTVVPATQAALVTVSETLVSRIDALPSQFRDDGLHARLNEIGMSVDEFGRGVSGDMNIALDRALERLQSMFGELTSVAESQGGRLSTLLDARHKTLMAAIAAVSTEVHDALVAGISRNVRQSADQISEHIESAHVRSERALQVLEAQLTTLSQRLDMLSTESQINMKQVIELEQILLQKLSLTPLQRLVSFFRRSQKPLQREV